MGICIPMFSQFFRDFKKVINYPPELVPNGVPIGYIANVGPKKKDKISQRKADNAFGPLFYRKGLFKVYHKKKLPNSLVGQPIFLVGSQFWLVVFNDDNS